jgi:Tol biopolymer transport system component
MTMNDRLAPTLADWLHEDAVGRIPDHLTQALAMTSETRQRPAWSSLERWLPVDTAFRPRLFQTPRLGQILVLAALVLIVLAGLLLYAPSRYQKLPPPFGPARNGAFVGSRDGDIYTYDAATSKATLLIGGGAYDFGPGFSRDGTKILFLRSDQRPPTAPDSEPVLSMMVANADGTDVHAITSPQHTLDWLDWSPDGTQVAYVTNKELWVADVAGGAPRRILGTGPAHFPTWLPPDGKQIIFRSETATPGIFTIPADGTGQRSEISTTAPVNQYDFDSVVVSPNGQLIAYTQWANDDIPSVHAIDVASGDEITYPTSGTGARGAMFSPDGKHITYVRLGDDMSVQIVVAAADGSGGELGVGPAVPHTPDGPAQAGWTFAPDGTALIARFGTDDAATTYLIPLDGSPSRVLDSGAYESIDVQRRAP